MHKIGNYEISSLVTEKFRLDGGAMFGSVPKALWSKQITADELNRITLVCRVLVLRGKKETILIDVGMGRKWKEKEEQIFAIEYRTKPLHQLIPEVSDLLLTHLHFDHAAGVTHHDDQGKAMLSFPNATHYLSKKNHLHAMSPGPRERASYLKDTIEPLAHAQLHYTSSGEEVLPGIRVFYSEGHTHGLQWILIGEGKGAVAYPADLIPTAHHVPIPYVMGYDLCAETTMAEKTDFLEQASKDEWVVVFEHDEHTPAAKIQKEGEGRFFVGEKVNLLEFS